MLVFNHRFTLHFLKAMNPDSLLDLAFGEAADNSHLPPAEYLPALEKQRELEALLRQQQVREHCPFACFVCLQNIIYTFTCFD